MKRQNLRTVALIVVTFTYLLIGAAIFGYLESDHEVRQREALELIELIVKRKYNISEDDFTVLTTTVIKSVPHKAGIQWKFSGAFYFATTVVTTIGYGHSTPATMSGRSFCMIYALIGIPLGLVMFQSIGERLNTFVGWALKYGKRCVKANNQEVTQTNLVMVVSVLSTILMTSMAAVFAKYERWDYFDALYYCFITLTTIGFGDYVALQKESALQSKPEYVALSLVFILFGLSVVSSAVNLLVLKFLTLNTEDERRDEQLRYTANLNSIQLEGDVITPAANLRHNKLTGGRVAQRATGSCLDSPDEEEDHEEHYDDKSEDKLDEQIDSQNVANSPLQLLPIVSSDTTTNVIAGKRRGRHKGTIQGNLFEGLDDLDYNDYEDDDDDDDQDDDDDDDNDDDDEDKIEEDKPACSHELCHLARSQYRKNVVLCNHQQCRLYFYQQTKINRFASSPNTSLTSCDHRQLANKLDQHSIFSSFNQLANLPRSNQDVETPIKNSNQTLFKSISHNKHGKHCEPPKLLLRRRRRGHELQNANSTSNGQPSPNSSLCSCWWNTSSLQAADSSNILNPDNCLCSKCLPITPLSPLIAISPQLESKQHILQQVADNDFIQPTSSSSPQQTQSSAKLFTSKIDNSTSSSSTNSPITLDTPKPTKVINKLTRETSRTSSTKEHPRTTTTTTSNQDHKSSTPGMQKAKLVCRCCCSHSECIQQALSMSARNRQMSDQKVRDEIKGDTRRQTNKRDQRNEIFSIEVSPPESELVSNNCKQSSDSSKGI